MRQEISLNKPLPSNEEAERAILGGILLDNNLLLDCVDKLVPNDFYSPLNRRIYEAMVSLYNAGTKVDPITISGEITKNGYNGPASSVALIANITLGIPHFTDLTDWIEIVKEKSQARKLIQICSLSTDGALSEDGDVDELLDQHEQLIYDLRSKRQNGSFTRLSVISQDTVRQLEEFGRNPKDSLLGITTGFRDLDIRTSGFEKKDFIILAARPSMGKTALACRMCYRAALSQNAVIAVFSLEMSKRQISQRIIAVEAGVDLMRLRKGQLTHDEWNRVHFTTDQFKSLGFHIDDTPGLTALDIKSRVRRLASAEGRIDLVMIDHLGLVSHMDGKRSRHLQLSDISKAMKAMAKEMDVPVLALHQLSRLVESRKPPRPMMSDLRESGAIEEDADIVMFIYREAYYKPEMVQDHTDAEIIFGKVRNGPTGSDHLAFIKQYTRFENISHGVAG